MIFRQLVFCKTLGNDLKIFMPPRTNYLQAIDQYGRILVVIKLPRLLSPEEDQAQESDDFNEEDLAEDTNSPKP